MFIWKGGEDMNGVEKYIYDNYSGLIKDLGYSPYYIEYTKNHKDIYLRLYIEPLNPTAILDIDACEVVSRSCSDAFDNDGNFPLKDAYILEVSSPGIERELHTPEHYKRYVDEKIRVRLYKAIDNQKEHVTVLKAATEDGIEIELNNRVIALTYKDISKAQLYCDF